MKRGLPEIDPLGRAACRAAACAPLLSVVRSALTYTPRLRARDAPVLEAMRALAAQYPRCGYRLMPQRR